jgi:hypothetical protein
MAAPNRGAPVAATPVTTAEPLKVSTVGAGVVGVVVPESPPPPPPPQALSEADSTAASMTATTLQLSFFIIGTVSPSARRGKPVNRTEKRCHFGRLAVPGSGYKREDHDF